MHMQEAFQQVWALHPSTPATPPPFPLSSHPSLGPANSRPPRRGGWKTSWIPVIWTDLGYEQPSCWHPCPLGSFSSIPEPLPEYHRTMWL